MASVRPHKVRLCSGCKAAGLAKPAGGDGCRCKVLSWRVFWRQPDGSKRSAVRTLKRDADAVAAEVESTQVKGTYVDPADGRQLFDAFAGEWAAGQDWKPGTAQNWPGRLARLRWALGDGVRLADIDRLAFKRARNKLAGRYAAGTVTGDMRLLRAVLREAVAVGKLGRDPTAGLSAAPKRRQGDTDGVTPDMVPSRAEALAILAGATAGWRAAIALGLAGVRIGEMLGVRKDRLQLDERKVTVDCQALQLTGQRTTLASTKNEKVRSIVVSPLVAVELRRHLRDGHGGTWTDDDDVEHEMLFLRPDGELWRQDGFNTLVLAKALKAAGLPKGRFRFHSFRHFCASTLLAEGASLPMVAGYLGDAAETVLKTYAHWLPDDEDVPAAILERVLAPDGRDASPMPHAVEGGGES